MPDKNDADLSSDYARDTHHGGLGDDYARDSDTPVTDEKRESKHDWKDEHLGKASE